MMTTMIVLEIPGVWMGSHLVPGRVEPGFNVLLRMGSSIEESHRRFQDNILNKTRIPLIKDYCPNGNTESTPQDEMALTWFDSDMADRIETSPEEAVMKN
jgi:hypothetical protein